MSENNLTGNLFNTRKKIKLREIRMHGASTILTPSEWGALTVITSKIGISRSEFMRRAVLKAMGKYEPR